MCTKIFGLLSVCVVSSLFWISIPACAASDENTSVVDLYHDAAVVIKGRIVALEGSCNAISCDDINYVVETQKLFVDRDAPDIRYSDIIEISICAHSGLELGSKYIFMLKNSAQLHKDRIILHGVPTTLPCQYYAPIGSVFAELDQTHHYRMQKASGGNSAGDPSSDQLSIGKREVGFEQQFQRAIDSEPEEKERALNRSRPPKLDRQPLSSPQL